MNKTILVAGAAGFIGSHLCERLLQQNFRVIGVDNFCTGRKKNIQDFFENKNFSFLEHDIIKPLLPEEKIDFIFNLASPASPKQYTKMPIETLLVGSLGVKNMLGLALENNAGFLQASTSEVYGNPLEHPQKESYFGNVNPVGPRSSYDESKRFAEALVMAYNRKHGAETRIVRIFNTYGPRMQRDDGRVISNFIAQAINDEPITVYGAGRQTRSFCYVSDLVNGLIKAMHCNYSPPINLGNPEEHKIIEIAEKIKILAKSKSKIVFRRLPEDDPQKRKPDTTIAKKLLAWKPVIGLDQGLKQTIEWFRQNQ